MAIIVAITFIFCLLIGRFFYIQVIWSDSLKYKALDQWTREIPIVAERGRILDRNGAELAVNELSYSVFVRPVAVKNKEKTALILSEIFSLEYSSILKKLSSSVSEVTVVKKADKSLVERLANENLEGVYYARDNSRYYPYGDSLGRVLGYTSSDSSGIAGLEKYYDKYLKGVNGELLYETDLVGVDINGAVATYKEAENGYDIRTCIDISVQKIAEEAIKKAYLEYSPKNAQCIVMDCDTFEILALAEAPCFDLNDVPRNDTQRLNEQSRNNAVCDIYEPGSTFKIITTAASLEEYFSGNKNALSPNYVFSSAGTRTVDSTKIKCWTSHTNGKHSNQTVREALNNSCNPCFVDMAMALGKSTFYKYLKAFNFGNVTGVDFGGEALGMLINESSLRDCDLARVGFGQTIAVTPIQLVSAVAAAVNGGYYYSPRFVKSIEDTYTGVKYKVDTAYKGRTVSEKTSRLLAEMLEGVVKEGSGKKAYIEGYKVGGKTGTAQKFEDGHIASGKYVSSFIGFFPSDDPKYIALVTIDEPKGAYYGSVVAAPIAKEVFEGIIKVKNIPPFEEVEK